MTKIFLLASICISLGGCGTISQEPGEKITTGSSESSSLKSLNWLQSKQNKDGTWGSGENKDVLTALATLAFISRNETPASEEYGETVLKALKAIVARTENSSEINQSQLQFGAWPKLTARLRFLYWKLHFQN